MKSYLPFGKKIIPTQEEILKEKEKFQRYDYYGIPYGRFDSSEEGEENMSQKDIDREQAKMFILSGKEIPKDLEIRLLQYKEKEQACKRTP